jgi:hypothetical protein
LEIIMSVRLRRPALVTAALLAGAALVLSAQSAPASAATPLTVDQKADALLPKPALISPVTRTLTPASPTATLADGTDYIIKIAAGAVFTKPITIQGGHNVVLESAVITYAAPADAEPGWLVRGLYLKSQTGVMWVNNLQIRGPLAEGIDLDQRAPGATVVLRNIAIDLVSGTYDTNHADLLQTWAGPSKLVVDGLTGSSNYQGMFLVPDDLWADGTLPEFFALRHITMDVSTGYYALWSNANGAYPIAVNDVKVKYNPARPSRSSWLMPKPNTGDTTWNAVTALS